MNSISSVTGIDIDKAGAVIKDTIKGISIGVTKGIIAFFLRPYRISYREAGRIKA